MNYKNARKSSVLKSSLNVAIILIIVKIIGLIKQSVVAAFFGTSLEMDSYLLVFDFIVEVGVVIFSSLSVSFLNYYILFTENNTKEERDKFVLNVFTSFIPIAIVFNLIIIVMARPLSFILAPGFSPQDRINVIYYLRILSFAILSSCFNNIFIAILEAEKDFIPGKLSGLLQSLCIITGCLFFSASFGINSLIISYLIYCILQNVFLFIQTSKYVRYAILKNSHNPAITNILKQSCPLFVSNAVTQINAIVDKAISSGLGSGNVSALSYAYFIFSSVHSIIIGGSCSVIFSHFSSYVAEKKIRDLNNLLKDSISIMAMFLFPVVLFLCLYSELIIQFLYGRGKFNDNSILLTSGALMAYSIGLLFIGIKDIFIRLHYAFQDTKTPMKNGIFSVTINICLSIAMSKKWGSLGIAFASSISQICGMILILFSSRNYIKNFSEIFQKKMWFIMILASIIAIICSKQISMLDNKYNVIIQLSINGICFFGIYYLILLLSKCEYILLIIGKTRRKYTK